MPFIRVFYKCFTAESLLGICNDYPHYIVFNQELPLYLIDIVSVYRNNIATKSLKVIDGIMYLKAPRVRHVVIINDRQIV